MRVDIDNLRLIIPPELAELNQKITTEQKDTFITCLNKHCDDVSDDEEHHSACDESDY